MGPKKSLAPTLRKYKSSVKNGNNKKGTNKSKPTKKSITKKKTAGKTGAKKTMANATFRSKKPGQDYYTINDVETLGWINDPFRFGELIHIEHGRNRYVYTFQLGNTTKFYAWANLVNGKANLKKLKKGKCYTLVGAGGVGMKVETKSKKYFKGYHSTSKYTVLLPAISVVEEKFATPSQRIATQQINFDILSDKIRRRKPFTENVENITIVDGKIYRYFGCETCSKSIRKADKNGKFYCKSRICKKKDGPKQGKPCFMIRMLKLKESGKTLSNFVCFEKDCKALLGEETINRIYRADTDIASRKAFKEILGSKVNGTLKYEKNPSGYDQQILANVKVVERAVQPSSSASTQKSTATKAVVPVVNSASGLPCCSCNDDDEDDDDTNADNLFIDFKNDFPSYARPITQLLQSITPAADQDENNYNLRKGLGIIINIRFEGVAGERQEFKLRRGSERDEEALMRMFPKLNINLFNGKPYVDINRSEFDQALSDFKNELKRKEKDYDFFFFVFMSHGALNIGRLYDTEEKNCLHIWRDIMYQFTNNKFPAFVGKLKMFIFQLCQNASESNLGCFTVEDQADRLTDAFYCTPCQPGYKAKRNKKFGAYFIQALAMGLERLSSKKHLEEILKEVQKYLSKKMITECNVYNDPYVYPIMVSYSQINFHNYRRPVDPVSDGNVDVDTNSVTIQ